MRDEVIPDLIDPDRINDTFVEGVALLEKIGKDCVRFTLYATRNLGDGDIDRHVVARIIAPISVLPAAMAQTKAVLSGRPFLTASNDGALFQ
ncbi:MAG: hypothetical protein J0H51_13125 [Rhizobiales bacterium]|nr:hypothetical protein [Hyphomicrobiales bacterium]MBN9001796.1 hypothetical protein [Hyphomicrobiales bacterium]